ncbi:ATP-binding cassette sub-family C member 4-like isoform X1 [Tachypleus tridentatus]|uniref:ATP-binding cassette sub-family C member 4-like isoform X1 n=2 Tax=Tachypleus tridentatus TaxID=6853 RepID=UPI003FD632AB
MKKKTKINTEEEDGNPNPFENANFLSRILFWWVIPFFLKGSNKELEEEDLYNNCDSDSSERLGDILQREWNKEIGKLKAGKKPSLKKAVIRSFGWKYAVVAVLAFFEECVIRVLQPVMLGWVVRYFSDPTAITKEEMYLSAGGVCIMAAFYIFFHHPYFFAVQRTGMRLRIASCSLVYKKALKLSRASLGKTTIGQMVNLLSNDVNRFDQSVIFLPYLVVGPLQTVVIIAVLWQHLGPASFAGLSVLLLYIPFQGTMGRLFSKLRLKTASITDERIRLMNEIVSGMRVIKMYTWENPFADLIETIRRKEICKIQYTSILRAVNMSLFFVASKIILFICFITYVFMGRNLTAEVVFVSMALYNNLRLTMTLFFPFGVAQGAESLISLKRIEKFLLLEEQKESSVVNMSDLRPKLENCGVWMDKVTSRWCKEVEEPTLQNISFTVKPGELLAVVGPVGAGKTSLLMAILGELPSLLGEVRVRGKVAYASQEPWVFAGTVRDNVVFGNTFNNKKYQKILEVCALDKDIKQLPFGDKTLVGEKGVSLSGGQKARVSLARAIYVDADVYLLDDPLSAVDTAVAKHLFDKCINRYLKNKIRILVTHQLQFLKPANQILVLQEGKCFALGNYTHLLNSGIDFVSLMEMEEEDSRRDSVKAHNITIEQSLSISPMDTFVAQKKSPTIIRNPEIVSSSSISSWLAEEMKISGMEDLYCSGSTGDNSSRRHSLWDTVSVSHSAQHMVSTSQGALCESNLSLASTVEEDPHPTLTERSNGKDYPKQEEELRSTGSVKGTVYWYYIKTGAGWFLIPLLIISSIGAQALFSGSDFWLALWTNGEEARRLAIERHNMTNSDNTTNGTINQLVIDNEFMNVYTNIYIYSGMVGGLFILALLRTTLFFVMCMRSSVGLHNKMFGSIVRAPISFFDNNPAGRILNRFSKDLGTIDDLLPPTALDMTYIFLNLIGILVIVCIVSPWIALPTLILTFIFYILKRFYMATARDIKRLEGITRSPVFSHLSTSLYGLTTIRAFGAQQRFEALFDKYQDHHSSSWFLFISSTRWFGVVLDWLSCIYITMVTWSMVLSSESTSGGNVGLAISSAMMLSGMFQWGVRQSAEVENQMTAVERVMEYSNLPSEAPLEAPTEQQPPPDWPQQGMIRFENVSLKYSPEDLPVLKNLSCVIKPREKIGIVGRTGAGKSSIIAALFRMIEPQGLIEIDGIDTRNVGLHDLRGKISIIPQDPVLFTGPLRRNIDPFNENSNHELWQVLEEVQLKEVIEDLPGRLDTELAEGGSNFSVGQRQLICLARALLRKNRILVLDEATANVDPSTDNLIQKTIREKFKQCTVLTIAHRLHTIMDSDRVLVLEAGRIEEFDEPYILMKNESGWFIQMVNHTGYSMAAQLHSVAYQAHLARAMNYQLEINSTTRQEEESFETSRIETRQLPLVSNVGIEENEKSCNDVVAAGQQDDKKIKTESGNLEMHSDTDVVLIVPNSCNDADITIRL